ncbi:MAG: undecaprenyl-diphosphate phosphatase [Abditibacteriota bacterium]|nr:undecaprenyl-diphosphate phosphatase [Abditibacteriota bacterium]MBP5738197.1 undecaprenyl-diphosphate phosphatase [Abditibacteriota bacterium]
MKKFFAVLLVLFLSGTILFAEGESEERTSSGMSTAQAVILGAVEGLTEYLPVSSTGHLYLAERLIGLGTPEDEKAADSYVIAVQIGAILAVLVIYARRIKDIILGIFGKNKTGLKLAINIIVAFLPAVVIGLICEDVIKRYLFGLMPIAVAWLVGGVAILLTGKKDSDLNAGDELEQLSVKNSFIIGLAQCVAMWPGTSRSLVTLVAGKLVGLKTAAAVEFSFLLGLITLGAATCYEMLKEGSEIISVFGWASPLLGIAVAFVSAVIAVKWMVAYLNKHGLDIFGWYRIALSVLAFGLIFAGVVK